MWLKRTANNVLNMKEVEPDLSYLDRCGLSINAKCIICDGAPELMGHHLFHSGTMRNWWFMELFRQRWESFSPSDGKQILQRLKHENMLWNRLWILNMMDGSFGLV